MWSLFGINQASYNNLNREKILVQKVNEITKEENSKWVSAMKNISVRK